MYKIIKHADGLKFFEFYNKNNFHVILSNYGASIYQIDTIDLKNNLENITMTPPMINYYNNSKYFGLTVGRVAGRIGKASFKIAGKTYKMSPNERDSLLHSGLSTFAHKFFDFEIKDDVDLTTVTYKIFIKDMEDGFPGDLNLEVIYSLYKNTDVILVEYKAISSKDSFLNITNHSYFNLSGNLKRSIEDQVLSINKDKRALLDDDLILKELIPVEKEYDFRNPMPISTYLKSEKILSGPTNGYDDIYSGKDPLYLTLFDKQSGRMMTIESNYKDVVIYTNNNIENITYPSRVHDDKFLGIAIEPSRITNILKDESYLQQSNALYNYYIKYKFSLKEE